MRGDQVIEVTKFVMNYQDDALAQTPEEDPFQPFKDVRKPVNEQTIGEPKEAVESAAPAEAGAVRAPDQLFSAMACLGCHMLDQEQSTTNRGLVGPNFGNLAENAATRVAGLSAEEYVYQSITEPAAFVVEGYTPGIMPATFAETLSEEEIRGLVAWLLDPAR